MTDNPNGLNDFSKEFKVDGTAEIIDGKIKITNPEGGGKAAIVIPAEGLMVTVNGELLEDRKDVYAEDEIIIQPVEEKIPAEANLSFSDDMLEAVLEVKPEYDIRYILQDQPPKNALKFKAIRNETAVRGVSKEEINELFSRDGLVYGIDDDAVIELTGSHKPLSKIVAVGDPMEEGKDGYVVYKVTTEKEMVEYEEDAVQVNFRERFSIPQVNEGDVMALVYPPEEGVAGRQVDGEEILPPPVFEADIICKEGVALNRDRTQVLATMKGRPVIKSGKQHIIGVEKYYVHAGDVNMESGNLSFQGHLKVEGSVHEGMSVFADGDVIVTKNTAGAKITSGGNINIGGNCINSQVNAGGLQLVLLEMAGILNFFKVSLDVAIETLEQVLNALKERGGFPEQKLPKAMQSLLQSKFPEIFDFSNQFKKIVKEQQEFSIPNEILERVNHVVQFFVEDGILENFDEKILIEMLRYVEELSDIISALTETKADITVLYVQNSHLRCTGDINVTGPGAYNSTFECGKSINVIKLFRGGKINADGDVKIGELGSPGTSMSSGVVQVSDNSSIRMGKVHEGSKLKLGDRMFRLDSTYSNIKVYLDKSEDKVKVSYWK